MLAIVFAYDSAEPAELSIRSDRVREITQLIWDAKFDTAIDSCHQLVQEEPANPLVYFLLGIAYYSINNQYRNDKYSDSAGRYLDSAIVRAGAGIEKEKDQADMYFVLGSAYGCRALYRTIHSGWWGAFRDGHHSCDNLEKAYDLDSSFTDALSGMGAYHYWKSAKAKVLNWLPFVADRRKQGIAEIQKAVKAGGTMAPSANKSLLAIYFNEGRNEEVVALADSLASQNLLDPNSQLHKARALIALKRWEDAGRALAEVLTQYEKSNYNDECGAYEVVYLKAKILMGQGDLAGAREYVRQIMAADTTCKANGYFKQSLMSSKELLK